METGPIRVFGELIPDRILARAAEELLQESNEHGDRADCARYIVECAAHHVRYPDSTQSFHSTVCLDAELEFKEAIPGDPTPNRMLATLKALYDEACAARSTADGTPPWD